MSRRRKEKPLFYYCPKCGQKKLRSDYVSDLTVQRYQCRRVWVCDAYHASPGHQQEPGVKAQGQKCDVRIDVPGRDAEIIDYHNVLDRMASSTPAVISWLLSNDHSICKTGIKCLYEGKNLDVVRYRKSSTSFESGIGIYMVPHFIRFDEPDVAAVFKAPAADHVKFGRHAVRRIFWQSRPMLYHNHQESTTHGGPIFSDKTESPELTKMIVDWAKDLDARFDDLQKEVAAAQQAYGSAEDQLKSEITSLAGRVLSFDTYDHVKDRVWVKITGSVTRAEALAMAQAIAHLRKETAAASP